MNPSAPSPASRSPLLRSSRLRDTLYAPELERFLARGSVDLAVVDQIEALQVRVNRGYEVLEARLRVTIELGRRLAQWYLAGASVCGGAVVAALIGWMRAPWATGTIAISATVGAAFFFSRTTRMSRDVTTLRGLRALSRRARATQATCKNDLVEMADALYRSVCAATGRSEEACE